MDSIDCKLLTVTSKSPFSEHDICQENKTRNWPKTPFPIDEDLNNRIVLYDGDIELLRAEVIVNPTNENFTQLGNISKSAGPELESYIRRKIKVCATGDVRITPGFKSNYNYIIHAVPPKYQPKYKTAAETALFHTYFRILELVIERRFRTVVMPVLATSKCNMPLLENCHMQLRIIRRILEKKRNEFDRIVIHVDPSLGDYYNTPFYCYFPRSALDEERACYHLDVSIGGPNGEPVIPEREIRIKSKPGIAMNPDHEPSIDLTSGLDLSTVVGKTAFSKMRDDLDKQRENAFKTTVANAQSNQVAIRRRVFKGCTLL